MRDQVSAKRSKKSSQNRRQIPKTSSTAKLIFTSGAEQGPAAGEFSVEFSVEFRGEYSRDLSCGYSCGNLGKSSG